MILHTVQLRRFVSSGRCVAPNRPFQQGASPASDTSRPLKNRSVAAIGNCVYHDLKSSATMSTGMRLDARMSTASPKAAMVGYEVGADQVVAARLMHSLTEYSSGRPFVPVWRRYSSADRNGVCTECEPFVPLP